MGQGCERAFSTVRYVESRGVDGRDTGCDGLAYWEAGAGPPILLVHDFGVDGRVG
jgi:hypothetical protein